MKELVTKRIIPIVQTIIMVLIGLIPIFVPYGSSYSIATIIALFCSIVIFICLPFIVKEKSILICIPILLISFFLLHGFSLSHFISWFLVIVLCLFFLSAKQKFKVLSKTVKYCSCVCAIVILIQVIVHYLFNFHIPFIISNLCIPEIEGTYYEAIENGFDGKLYRPSALFVEPAAFSQYCIVGLVMFMFDKGSIKSLTWSIVISLGIVCSTSGLGIVMVALAWIGYIGANVFLGNKKARKFFLIILLATIIAIVVAYNVLAPLKSAIDRIVNGEAISGRIKGWAKYFTSFSGLDFMIGKGSSSLPANTYLTGMMQVIWAVGIFGLILFIVFFILALPYLSYQSIVLIILFALLQLFANNMNLPFMFFFFSVVMSKSKPLNKNKVIVSI